MAYFEDMEVTVFLSIIMWFFPVRILLEMCFAAKAKRTFSLFNIINILDMSCFIVMFVRFIREFEYYREGIYDEEGKEEVRYFENIYEFHDDEVLIDVLYSVAMACLWMRFIYSLRLNRFLGPLVKMIQMMIYDIMVFLVLFVCDLLIFASIGTLLFVSADNYKNLNEAMVTLFTSAMGGFDFTIL